MDNETTLGMLIKTQEDEFFKILRGQRGRDFASDAEAWAEFKAVIDRAAEQVKTAGKLHGNLWKAHADKNDDEFYVTVQELERTAADLAREYLSLAALCAIARNIDI